MYVLSVLSPLSKPPAAFELLFSSTHRQGFIRQCYPKSEMFGLRKNLTEICLSVECCTDIVY